MDNQKRVSLGVVVVAVLVALYLYSPAVSLSFFPVASHGQQGVHLSFLSSDKTVLGGPSLTVQQIDSVLCRANSPACGTGQSMYDLSRQYQINDSYALATFKKESSYGLAGVATVTHGLGNIRCTTGYACYEGFRVYVSWQAGYADFFQLIRNLYVDTWHLSSVGQIIPRYAPSTENDTQKYVSDVLAAMSSY